MLKDADISQSGLHLIFGLIGSPPQPKKRFWAAPDRCYLGTSVHVGWAHYQGFVRVQPKSSSVVKVCQKIDGALSAGALSRDEAGKLRGDVQWLFSCCAGAAAKFAAPLLQRCQYSDDASLLERDRLVLQTLKALACLAAPRDIDFWSRSPPCVLIYSDASFEKGELRLGWVIYGYGPPPLLPCGGTCAVPHEVFEEWLPRRQQIFPGEALCLLLLPLLYPQIFQSRDVLWFIDNQAAVVAAVKAASSQEDVFEIAHLSCLLRAQLRCRAWFEWIDSDSNPSDGLSRDGLADSWTNQQGWYLQSFDFPARACRSSVRDELLVQG